MSLFPSTGAVSPPLTPPSPGLDPLRVGDHIVERPQ
jgi:hypothetical protein